jgi:hypothetical protein
MTKRRLMLIIAAIGIAVPAAAFAAGHDGASCCPGLCCLFGCSACP